MTITWSIGVGQLVEERLERGRSRWRRRPRCSRAELGRGLLEALGIAAGQDDVGALGAGAPGGLEPDAGAAADHDDGLPEQLRLARHESAMASVMRPTCRRRRGDLGAERLQRVGVDLGEGRERLDRVAQHVERYVGADGQRGLLEPLAGLRPERVRAGQPLAVAEEGQEAVRLGVGACVGGGPRDARQPARCALKRASGAPTDAACGSVKTTRGRAS